eukprot:TRINITY_DN2625_c0_g1_i1.p1 TRINITY_DN2625_c0_g1~~TRINITY_DN2625_c0_g1_i1.p1  ORF type:complete len:277 (-),score=84.51 TRINITY_DN2625_c0_g1_i1:133-963(-)
MKVFTSSQFLRGFNHQQSFSSRPPQTRGFASATTKAQAANATTPPQRPPSKNSNAVLLPSSVDLSKLKLDEVKKNSQGGTIIPLSYDTDNAGRPVTLKIQTPVVRVPSGITKATDMKTGEVTGLSLQMSLDGIESNPSMKQFYDFLQKFDEKMMSFALKEAKVWFKNKPVSPELLRVMYKPSLKVREDGSFPPAFKVKIPTFGDRIATDVYYNKEQASLDLIQKRAQVVSIVEPRMVWFISNSSWGVSWAALQIKVLEPGSDAGFGNRLSEYAFLD